MESSVVSLHLTSSLLTPFPFHFSRYCLPLSPPFFRSKPSRHRFRAAIKPFIPPFPHPYPRVSASLTPPDHQSSEKSPDLSGLCATVLHNARKPLSFLFFCIAVGFLPIPTAGIRALAVAATVQSRKEKTRNSDASMDHEFSEYTRKLLADVSVLLQRIEKVRSSRGDMDGVREALRAVKKKRKEVQEEVLRKLNLELRELQREKMQLVKRSEDIMNSALAMKKRQDKLSRKKGDGDGVRKNVQALENSLVAAEKEYSDIWEKVGDIEDRILRRETLTFSIAIRELSFIERESELLVERFGRRSKQDSVASPLKATTRLSRDDIKKELETAQNDYWEQMLLPKVLEAEDPEIYSETSTGGFVSNIRRALKESKQMQMNMEAQLRRKLKKFGDENLFLAKTSEDEVLKGFPEAELKWMFGQKEFVIPRAVSLHLFHGWKKWREEAKANLKKELLENMDHGRHYMDQRKGHIIKDREKLMTKTWYNDERNRWEMDPVAVPFAVSKRLVGRAHIRHDWAVMYLTLKGEDKEYYVDLKKFDILFEDFGGFDGLYVKMLASGVPTSVQLMWIPLSELDIRQQFLVLTRPPSQFLVGLWKSSIVSYMRKWSYSKTKDIIDDLMIIVGFPLVEFIIPKQIRMSLGMAWPEEAYQTVGATWYLEWQSVAELNHRSRKKGSIWWYFWFLMRSAIFGFLLFHVFRFSKRNIPRFLGYGPFRRDPNLRKFRRVRFYFKYKLYRTIRRKKEGIDPIRSAFDQMKRVKNPPIRLQDFASVESMREEINDIVTCLRNPTAFQEKGARAPRGVLIVGERGTGKTSLALAIAAEARVPVVQVEARQLEPGLWVGQSASNVRELFQTARDLAPVIIFVEDFDLFAGVRGQFIHTKKQDHEAFINQLLVELDGFEKQDGVVLIATTRTLKQIDAALRRPGRMDRVLHLQRPTQMEREKILRLAAKETMDDELINFVDWKKVAEKTALLRPIELKFVPLALEGSAFRSRILDADELNSYCNWFACLSKTVPKWLRGTKIYKRISKSLVNHLGLTLTREDMESVVDLMEPYGQISNGIELYSPPLDWTRETKFPHAVWAAGRALIALLLPNFDVVDNIWLEPAAWEGIGCTKISKAKNEGSVSGNLESRSYLEKKLVFCFGSHVASQLLLPFGEENFLSTSELKQAQEIATRMVIEYGWSPDDSPAIYITSKAVGALSMGNSHEFEIEAKVQKIYDLAYDKAKEMLQKNRKVLEIIVEQLLNFENLTGEDLLNILKNNGEIPEKEPFFLSKQLYKKLKSGSSLDESGDAEVLDLLGVAT
ncbi:probable inactive ATP-dependent zinc metalloprotease FTSHI 5, chloroplastic isoform X1 [Musa acuminata AAA Group]|uniref:probable inactive ATP-dependent zinc metalloprotease FTSHI 5, chloroplastic isoform X1 n=1 Tax=Musa acuminata AAA Group TaxID=214697 RepID=UPI0031DC7B2D